MWITWNKSIHTNEKWNKKEIGKEKRRLLEQHMNRIIDITKWIWKLNILLKSENLFTVFFLPPFVHFSFLFAFTISFNTLVKGILNNSFPTSDKNKRYAYAWKHIHIHFFPSTHVFFKYNTSIWVHSTQHTHTTAPKMPNNGTRKEQTVSNFPHLTCFSIWKRYYIYRMNEWTTKKWRKKIHKFSHDKHPFIWACMQILQWWNLTPWLDARRGTL